MATSTYLFCPACKRSVARGALVCGACGASVVVGDVPPPAPGTAARTLAAISLVGIALFLAVIVPVIGVPLLALLALVVLVKIAIRLF